MLSKTLKRFSNQTTGQQWPKAVENQQKMAEMAGLNIKAIVMDGNDLNLSSETYDVVYGNAILHHLQLDKACMEIKRVLKSGGKAVFRDNMKGNVFLQAFRRATPHLRTSDEHPLATKDINLLSKDFAAAEVDFYIFSILPYRFIAQTLNQGVLKRLGWRIRFPHPDSFYAIADRVDAWLFKVVPFLRKQAWLCLITLTK